MDANKLGKAFGFTLTLLVATLCGYAATTFVTFIWNPSDWTPAGRLVFLGTALFVYPKLFDEE